jgi:ribosome-associated protein
MAKKKKEVSTKKTAGKSAVKSVKKATPKKASVKKKSVASTKASADKVRSKLSKSKKASAVKKKAKPVVKKASAAKTLSAKSTKKAAATKKAVPTRKKAVAKKSAPAKKAAAKKAPVKKTVAKKKTVVAKKITPAKKTAVKKTVNKKKAAVKKVTVAKKATVAKKTVVPAAKPAKTAVDNVTTKTSFVKNFALTSTADLTTEKEKESAKTNTLEASSENGATTREAAVKTHLKVVEPKKKEIKHTITDASVDAVKHLADIAVEGILEVKGRNISVLNLKNIHNRVCDYFIICQADSNTQVNAIAGSVEEMVKKLTGERPYRKEGFENAEWILVDYVTVVVHIFQSQIRNFYNLESLWADAEITELAFD